MKTAIDSYGGVKGCQAAVVKIQESNQTMKKHKMTGVQVLNNFTFGSARFASMEGLQCGPWKTFHTNTGEAIWFASGAYWSPSRAVL